MTSYFLHIFTSLRHFGCLLFLVGLVTECFAGEAFSPVPELTARQSEILHSLQTLKPPDLADDQAIPWMLKHWESTISLADIFNPTGSGNAADHFAKLDGLYGKERQHPGATVDVNSKGVEELLLAAQMPVCRMTPDAYPPFLEGTVRQPDFLAYRAYQQALLARAESQWLEGNNGEAEKFYQAALICGMHLANDRSTLVVYLTGLIFKLRAAQGYARFLSGCQRFDEARRMELLVEETMQFMRAFYWKSSTALGEFLNFASLPALIEVALRDEDVCWRQEAVIRLGVFRHGAPNWVKNAMDHDRGWEKLSEETLTHVASSDPSPSLRKLTLWTIRTVTPELYKTMEHRFPGEGQ